MRDLFSNPRLIYPNKRYRKNVKFQGSKNTLFFTDSGHFEAYKIELSFNYVL